MQADSRRECAALNQSSIMNVSTCCASFLFSHAPVETKDPRKIPITHFYHVTVKKEPIVVQKVNHVFNVYTRWKKSAVVFFFGLFFLFFFFWMTCVYIFTRTQNPVKTLRDVFVSAYECFHVTTVGVK